MSEARFTVNCAAPEQKRGMIHLGAGCVYIMRHTLLAYEDEEFREALDDLARVGVSHLRCHYWLSDSANGVFPEGGAKCYREDAAGNPIYDWERMDKILDAWLERGMAPIFELSHVPDALTAAGGDQNVRFPVPNDYRKYYDLVYETVKHLQESYGKERTRGWLWECPNEPDFGGLVHAPEEVKQRCMNEFFKMYDHLIAAAHAVDPELRIGGPASVFTSCLESFLDHCANGPNFYEPSQKGAPVDWVSAHKYALSLYRYDEDPDSCTLKTANILDHAAACKSIMDRFGMGEKEYWVDEWGIISRFFDTVDKYPIVALRDTEYVALFMLRLLDGLFEQKDKLGLNVNGLIFCGEAYEMEREILYENRAPLSPFSGTRAMHTCHAVRKPIMNAFEMVSKMGGQRLAVSGPEFGSQTRAFATTDDAGDVAVLVYNFDENLLDPEKECAAADVVVRFDNIGPNARCGECYCLSRSHSNAHTQWIAMGRPKELGEGQIDELKSRGRLETIAPPEITKDGDGLAARLRMPGNSAMMFVIK